MTLLSVSVRLAGFSHEGAFIGPVCFLMLAQHVVANSLGAH